MVRLFIIAGVTIFMVLLLLVATRVLPACGLVGGVDLLRVEFCPIPTPRATDAVYDARLRKAVLDLRLAQLRQQIDAKDCEPISVTANPPPPRPSVQVGQATEEVVDSPRSPEPPDIDPDAWQNEDIGLLDGCWNLDSDYATENVDTGEISTVVSWSMCFDEEGHGDQVLIYSSGVRCSAKVSSWFRDKRLIIHDQGDVGCSDGGRIYRREMVCDLAQGGHADCQSRAPEDPRPGGSRWSSFRLQR